MFALFCCLFFSDIRDVTRGDLFSWNRMKKIAKINLYDYKVGYFLKPNNPRFSRFHPSLQQKVSLVDLISIDKKHETATEKKDGEAITSHNRFLYHGKEVKLGKYPFPFPV